MPSEGEGLLSKSTAKQNYNTKLSDDEEKKFQIWKAKYAPNDSGDDYDLRGAFKAGLKPDPKTGHWPDTFKKPNHPTFSNESKYAKDAPEKAGSWKGEQYIPAPLLKSRTPIRSESKPQKEKPLLSR